MDIEIIKAEIELANKIREAVAIEHDNYGATENIKLDSALTYDLRLRVADKNKKSRLFAANAD